VDTGTEGDCEKLSACLQEKNFEPGTFLIQARYATDGSVLTMRIIFKRIYRHVA